MPRRGGTSGGPDPESRSARRRWRDVPSALRAVGPVRTVTSVAPHGPIPDEAPLRAQRHAARRTVHQRCARSARGRIRPGPLRLHGREPRSSCTGVRRPAAPIVRGCAARIPRRGRSPRAPGPMGARGCGTSGTTSRTTSARCTNRSRTHPARRLPTPPSTRRQRSSPASCSSTSTTTEAPWFAHLAYIRPHPPFVAPEPYASMYDPATVPDPVRRPSFEPEGAAHPVLAGALSVPGVRLGDDLAELRQVRATYYGMMTEVDAAARSSVRRHQGARALGRHARRSSRRTTASSSAITG